VVTAGSWVLFDYGAADTAMRKMAIAALRQLGFQGKRVAAMFGLTENYVVTLHRAALREGSVALIGQPGPGRAGKLAESRPQPGAPREAPTPRSAAGWGSRTPRSPAGSAPVVPGRARRRAPPPRRRRPGRCSPGRIRPAVPRARSGPRSGTGR
jgi:hypothetical protein